MTITVYYGDVNNMFLHEPENVYKKFVKNIKYNNIDYQGLHLCPAFRNFYHNTFSIKNTHYWSLIWNGREVYSNVITPESFNEAINVRNSSIGFVSFNYPNLLLIPNKSVSIEILNPTFSNSDINRKTDVIQGVFDVGSHIRKLELPFTFKHTNEEIISYPEDDLYYVRFKTEEKIKFEKFYVNDEVCEIIKNNLDQKGFTNKILPLSFWYKMNSSLNLKNKIINEIKKSNLLVK